MHRQILKIFFSRTTAWAIFYQTWHKVSLGDGDSSFFKWRVRPFPRGGNKEIVKIHWQILKIQTWHKAFWLTGIQVSSNDEFRPFPRGDNYEILKIHWRNSKIFFSTTTGPILTNLGKKHPWVKRIQVYPNWRAMAFSKGVFKIFSSWTSGSTLKSFTELLSQSYDIFNDIIMWS